MDKSHKIIRDTINRQSDKVTFPLHSNLLTILEQSISTSSSSQLLGYDEKRLHYFHTMYYIGEGYRMATEEQLAVLVDLSIRKVVPFTEGPMKNLVAMGEAHKDLPPPPQVRNTMKIPSLQK